MLLHCVHDINTLAALVPSRPLPPTPAGGSVAQQIVSGKVPRRAGKQELGTSEGRKSELGGNPLLLTLCTRGSLAAARENKRRKF